MNIRSLWAVAFASILTGVLASTGAQAPAETVVKAGRLLNPADGRVAAGVTILVRGDRIADLGPAVAIPPGARVIDLSSYTVLPGLIDAHTHILLQPEDERGLPPVLTKSQAFRTVQGVAAVRVDVEAGFTTERDLDSEGAGFADVAIRDAITQGIIPGPRLFVATYALTITAGHMNNAGLNPEISVPDPAAITDTRAAMVQEVRREVKYGADWIKLYATGTLRHLDPKTLEPVSQVSLEDVQAVVAEAKRWRRDVAAHAYGGEGAKNAVLGGVRSIEHGMLMDEETIKLLVEHGTYWCPTLSVYIVDPGGSPSDLSRRVIERHRQTFQAAMKAGVKIVFGTDVGAFPHGTQAREFAKMVEYGMTPIDAIRAATTRAAELLRRDQDLGALDKGRLADIIAVDGNPLENIRTLEHVAFVMKAGGVVKLPAPRAGTGAGIGR